MNGVRNLRLNFQKKFLNFVMARSHLDRGELHKAGNNSKRDTVVAQILISTTEYSIH